MPRHAHCAEIVIMAQRLNASPPGMQLAEHFNAEVAAGTIGSKQDAVDYLTWTFFFRRLLQNPSYYGLADTDEGDVNAFLSGLVEDNLAALEVGAH